MKVRLVEVSGGFLIVPVHTNGRTDKEREEVFIQSDYDFPGIASGLGEFKPCHECDLTDGTIDCEHKTVDDMISEARKFLSEHAGKIFSDPGYCTPEFFSEIPQDLR